MDSPSPHTPRVEAVLSAYIERVHANPTAVTDDEVRALSAAGLDDDALFELTVAAALGASHSRLELALQAMDKVIP